MNPRWTIRKVWVSTGKTAPYRDQPTKAEKRKPTKTLNLPVNSRILPFFRISVQGVRLALNINPGEQAVTAQPFDTLSRIRGVKYPPDKSMETGNRKQWSPCYSGGCRSVFQLEFRRMARDDRPANPFIRHSRMFLAGIQELCAAWIPAKRTRE